MLRRPIGLATLVATALLAVTLCTSARLRGAQLPPGPGPTADQPVQLTAAEAAQLARAAREGLQVDLPPGLELSLWASDKLVTDPVAIDLDADGTMWVAATARNNLPLDIRGHRDWMATVHTLKTVDDLRNFYAKIMTPENSDRNRWIPDVNNDGIRDITDLAAFKERVYRIEDSDRDGIADRSRVVYEGFNDDPTWDSIGGILRAGGDLIVGIPPGVYRMRDADGDGRYDARTTISDGFNVHPAFGGHGISGTIVGPDGRLYWEVGDMGFTVVDQAGRTWSSPHQGAVLRSELDGSGFEVYAAGLRNLQEFSFDEHGNLISVDNDGDHPDEYERLVYLPYGSDSGWRSYWQYGKYTDPKNNRYNVWMREGMFKPRHPGQAAHIVPPVAPWAAGPSGMAYNPGTALSDEWKHHFFVTSFPGAANNARIYAFTLKEEGAGFVRDSEKVLLRGVLAVGLKIGPDGALYVTDWINGWESKNRGQLWRIDAPAAAGSAVRKEVQALLAADFGSRSVPDLAALLRHADMRVRQKAQFDLVRRGDAATFAAVAKDPSHRLARLHAIWGIAQLARATPAYAGRLVPLLRDGDAEVRAQAAKMLGDVRHQAAAADLVSLLTDAAPRVRFFAAEALGRLAHKPAVMPLIRMLAENDGRDAYLQHAGSLALASIGDGPALEALATHASRGVRTAAVLALRRMRHAGVARFLADADEAIVTDAARAINDDGGIAAAVPALAALLGRTGIANEPLLRRIINANLRTGTRDALDRVTKFAGDLTRPDDLRVEAIATLGVWPDPSPMDRVDGFHHASVDVPSGSGSNGEGQRGVRDAEAARAAVRGLVLQVGKMDGVPGAAPVSADMKTALAEAAGRLGVKEAAPVLMAQLKGDGAQAVRLAALRALQTIQAGSMDELMQTALADKDAAVRRAALGILPSLKIPDAAKVQYLAGLLKGGTIPEKQGAFEVLGGLKSPESRRLLGQHLDELQTGTIPPDLQVDLLDAVQTDGSPELMARVTAYQQAKQADTLQAAFREGLLDGGDPLRGAQVVFQNPLAECTRCHTVRGGGGADVGPNLSRIGASLTREQLLDSLVNPNVRIAPGYGLVSVTLKDGRKLDGTLREETDTHLVLLTGTPPAPQRIAKSDIAERTNPLSAMPPLGLMLTPREVRDVVEFLATLK